jgi:hypothetical protein
MCCTETPVLSFTCRTTLSKESEPPWYQADARSGCGTHTHWWLIIVTSASLSLATTPWSGTSSRSRMTCSSLASWISVPFVYYYRNERLVWVKTPCGEISFYVFMFYEAQLKCCHSSTPFIAHIWANYLMLTCRPIQDMMNILQNI